jgi:uncharacterized protein (UPF0297 family)
MDDNKNNTMMYQYNTPKSKKAKQIIDDVYDALVEKGYDPMRQIVGYLLSGDPTYITNHKNARNIISRMERDELLMEIVGSYLKD